MEFYNSFGLLNGYYILSFYAIHTEKKLYPIGDIKLPNNWKLLIKLKL